MFNNFWYALMLSCLVSLSSLPTSTSVVRRPYDKHSKTRRVESTKARPVGRVIRYQIQIKELRQSSSFMGSSSKHSQLTTQQFLLWPSWSELQQATGHKKRPARAEQHVERGGGVCVSKRAATWKGSANTRETIFGEWRKSFYLFIQSLFTLFSRPHTLCKESKRSSGKEGHDTSRNENNFYLSYCLQNNLYVRGETEC